MQRRLEFEPEEHTDFIFEVVGVDGVDWSLLIGALAFLGAAAVLLWRTRKPGARRREDR